jgi:hypothetical protein
MEEVAMTRTLPKGHLSCLSRAFRYTPAVRTSVAATFARVKRELAEPQRAATFPAAGERRFPRGAFAAARSLLEAGGFRGAGHADRARD